jgi:hypothetical protein
MVIPEAFLTHSLPENCSANYSYNHAVINCFLIFQGALEGVIGL